MPSLPTGKKLIGEEMYARYSFRRMYPAYSTRVPIAAHEVPGRHLRSQKKRLAGTCSRPKTRRERSTYSYLDHHDARTRPIYGALDFVRSLVTRSFHCVRTRPAPVTPYDFELAEQPRQVWTIASRPRSNGDGLRSAALRRGQKQQKQKKKKTAQLHGGR